MTHPFARLTIPTGLTLKGQTMSAEKRMLEDILRRLDDQELKLKNISAKLDKVLSALRDLSDTVG